MLKDRVEDLDNILEVFHIGYKDNLINLNKQIN